VAAQAGKRSATPAALDLGGATSAGRVRERNEDCFLLKHQTWTSGEQRHDLTLAVVADGMGGYEGGDQASGMAVRSLSKTLTPFFDGELSGQLKGSVLTSIAEAVEYALQEANRDVYRRAQRDPKCKGMGATLALVLIWDREVLIIHVGDCRVYHQRAGRLTQVTRDQTLVARMIELGTLSPEEAENHPARNEVTQALGKSFDIKPATHRLTLERGDWLIVACDGLHTHVDAGTLQQEVTRAAAAPACYLAQRLVDLANERGGSDNCTVVALHQV
jgi:protein phosphatase